MRLVVCAAVAALLLAGCSRSNTPNIGQDGHVRQTTGANIIAAVDLGDLEAFFNAQDVKDRYGSDALINSGRVIALENNTRVHVLSAAIGRYQVRLLDGRYAPRAVWINWDALAP